jgi:hypothetical protein
MRRALFVAIVVFLSGNTFAQYDEEFEEERPSIFSATGYFRFRGYYLKNPTLKKEPLSYMQSRFRVNPEISPTPDTKIKAQIDIIDDVVWGIKTVEGEIEQFANFPSVYGRTPGEYPCATYADGTNILGCKENGISRLVGIKRVWGEIEFFFGKFFIGRMGSDFGMGIFENDGNGFKNEWGDAHYGDTRDRIMFGTKPLGREEPLIIVVGFDKVAENYLEDEPDVHQWFLVPLWKDEVKGIEGGGFLAARLDTQEETRTEIFIADPYIHLTKWRNFKFSMEGTILGGRTRALSDIMTSLGKPEPEAQLGILAFNMAGSIMYRYDPWEFQLDAGYSSGEKGGVLDGEINSIPFDPDFNVGLIMFEEVLARQSAELARGLGSEIFATRGAVSNALYIMPTFRFAPLPTLKSYLSILWARALDAPALVNPVNPGGLNVRNGKAGRNYGLEVDWGAKIGGDTFDVEVQLGYFMPKIFANSAFEGPEKPQNVFETLVKVNYKF